YHCPTAQYSLFTWGVCCWKRYMGLGAQSVWLWRAGVRYKIAFEFIGSCGRCGMAGDVPVQLDRIAALNRINVPKMHHNKKICVLRAFKPLKSGNKTFCRNNII
ncbi:MAG: hypothetical protein AAGC95_18085, partial [Pseudomonadota bacterium]